VLGTIRFTPYSCGIKARKSSEIAKSCLIRFAGFLFFGGKMLLKEPILSWAGRLKQHYQPSEEWVFCVYAIFKRKIKYPFQI